MSSINGRLRDNKGTTVPSNKCRMARIGAVLCRDFQLNPESCHVDRLQVLCALSLWTVGFGILLRVSRGMCVVGQFAPQPTLILQLAAFMKVMCKHTGGDGGGVSGGMGGGNVGEELEEMLGEILFIFCHLPMF